MYKACTEIKTMKLKDTKINIRVSRELAERLSKASQVTERPASQIAREAVSEKLNQLAEQFPQLAAA